MDQVATIWLKLLDMGALIPRPASILGAVAHLERRTDPVVGSPASLDDVGP